MSNLEIDFSQNKEKVNKKIQNIKKKREKKKKTKTNIDWAIRDCSQRGGTCFDFYCFTMKSEKVEKRIRSAAIA